MSRLDQARENLRKFKESRAIAKRNGHYQTLPKNNRSKDGRMGNSYDVNVWRQEEIVKEFEETERYLKKREQERKKKEQERKKKEQEKKKKEASTSTKSKSSGSAYSHSSYETSTTTESNTYTSNSSGCLLVNFLLIPFFLFKWMFKLVFLPFKLLLKLFRIIK